ncbi:MAG: EAL domain-containing protein [Actinomycetia bacterium]|nr:EAL domain-containing protein [Actinomycetes bacterium]
MNLKRLVWARGRTTAAVLVILVAVAMAVFSGVEALEERRSAAAAVDLRFATLTVSAADSLAAFGAETSTSTLAASVDQLAENHDLALHALLPAEREEAERLVAEIAGCGVMLLDLDDHDHTPHGHQELQDLLEVATGRAAAASSAAEAQAVAWLLVAGLVFGLGTYQAFRSRARAARERAAAAARIRAGERVERLLNDSPDIFIVFDGAGTVTYRSASASVLLASQTSTLDGFVEPLTGDHELLKTHLTQAGVEGAAKVFELVDVEGRQGWFELRVSDLTDDDLVGGHLITARDITNETQLRDDLVSQARTDMLTGLPNRRALDSALVGAKRALEANGGLAALVSLDLDGFKSVNDTLGHEAGDQLLVQAARRLTRALGPEDLLLRLGGDEFAVLLSPVPDSATAREAATRILGVFDQPFRLGPRLEHLRTSVGVAVTDRPEQVAGLVGEADIAMYESKRGGGNVVAFFSPEMEADATFGARVTQALRAADYDEEFSLVYQPIVTVETGQVVSYEALLRWVSPSLGSVPPDQFIPVAETSGEIRAIGKWVLNGVCQQVALWEATGMDPDITISFNVSARQLADDAFVHCVRETAHRWGVRTSRLVVEVTESSVLDHSGVARHRLEEIREAGLRISIDDFGSGYSNFGQLLAVPFDIIKIDRSLLLTLTQMRQYAGGDPSGPCAIMGAIVSIASVLGAPVVCEGVETEMQRRSLEASGITHIQGYLTGRPAAPTELVLSALV